ncbi:MAG TPA: DUF4394 domain-containing protein, partial [Pyrinomonadaceae bacterium]
PLATAQALAEGDDYHIRTLAPDPPGKIAFASDRAGNFDIYVMNPDGSGLVRLTSDPAEDVQPTWSPDGRKIAFVSNRDGNKEIYVVNVDGGGLTRLTNNTDEDISPAWSPSVSNQQIAFVSHRDGNDEIYLMNADGTGQSNLTLNGADDNDPAWAPSGTQLAFATNRDGDKFELYRVNTDRTGLTRLTNNSFNDVAPAWPPGRITFQSDRDGNDELYTVNALDGSNPVRLTNNAAFDLDPARSSDGARLVFVSNRDVADNLEIYAANADGSNVVRLTNSPASDIDPAIQPFQTAATLGSIQLSASVYIVSEGQRTLDITVTRTGGTGAASVDITTVNGSASDRTDFTPIARTLHFGAGETSKTVRLSVIDDLRVEGDETLTVSLSNPVNTTIGTPSSAVVTIMDNDSTIPAANATLYGVTAAGNLVRFSSATPGTIDASVAITGLQTGETILGMDTRPATRQLYALGSTGRIYVVNPVTGAARQVSTVAVALNGASFGVDFNPTVDRLRIVSDADQNLRVNVDTGATTVDTPLNYAVGDVAVGANPNVVGIAYTNNVAGATTTTLYGIDSARDVLVTQNPPNNGTLNSVGNGLPTDTSNVVGFDITDSGAALAVLNVGGVSQLHTINLTTGRATLVGNVGGGAQVRALTAASLPANPIDDTPFFVRQQYLDFLGREPDAAGFNAYVNLLDNCPDRINTPGCDRVTVSAAFVGSPEFQQRGAFIVRTYLAAFGRLPTYREFVRDLSSIGGATGDEALANRARYPDDFVQRPEFGAIYDALSNAAYVDRLIANTGVAFPNRNQLVADLDAGLKTRGQALREITDNPQFINAAFNRVIVLMQYFGYLRRDPEPAGFNAYLNFLNANPNDFRTLVRAFVDSVEYRSRFGPP